MKKIFVLFFTLLMVLSLTACSSTSNNESKTPTTSKTEAPPKNEEPIYKEISKGSKIETDFVSITIDEVSITNIIRSIKSSTVLNAKDNEEYVYVKGTITNTSNFSYDLGSLGSYSYSSSVDTLIDSKLKMSNGEKEYGSLLIDDGGMYGIISDGKIYPQETVTFYFAFTVEKSQSNYYKNGEIIIAFADNFKEEPDYKHSNCEYLYKIKVK